MGGVWGRQNAPGAAWGSVESGGLVPEAASSAAPLVVEIEPQPFARRLDVDAEGLAVRESHFGDGVNGPRPGIDWEETSP